LKPKTSINFTQLMASEDSTVRRFLPPIVQEATLGMIHAGAGVGKTNFSLWLAMAVASGSGFLKWEGHVAGKVLYVDSEMTTPIIKQRIKTLMQSSSFDFKPDYFEFASPDQFTANCIPDISSPEGSAWLKREAADRDVIILDNYGGVTAIGDRNELDVWMRVQRLIIDLRSQGKCVIIIHHSGKAGQQLGTSKKEQPLDWVIHLRRPADYSMEDGSRFDLIFEKARNFSGKHAESLSLQLIHDHRKGQYWQWEARATNIEALVIKMRLNGMQEATISKETGIPVFTVKQICKKLKDSKEEVIEKKVDVGRGLDKEALDEVPF
jgi:AAA domain